MCVKLTGMLLGCGLKLFVVAAWKDWKPVLLDMLSCLPLFLMNCMALSVRCTGGYSSPEYWPESSWVLIFGN